MIKHILLSISEKPENSPETNIVLDIASRHNAEVTGFTAVDPSIISLEVSKPLLFTKSYVNKVDDLVKKSQEAAQNSLNKVASLCTEKNIKFLSAASSNSECKTMIDACRFKDLCITPTQLWEPGVEGLLSSDAILHLVSAGLRPLLAVPNNPNSRLPSKVIVALSGSIESAKALKHFIQLDLYPGIAIHLVTVGNPKSDQTAQELLDQAKTYLCAYDNPVSTACLDETEDRVSALINEADNVGADMFVIGSSYKRLAALKRFGKNAVGLIEQSKHPIFISH